MVTLAYTGALGQHTRTHTRRCVCVRVCCAAVFLLSPRYNKNEGMWHGAKCGELRPCGHLGCVITPDSRRDNKYIQPSSYTQVCRHARISRDLCARSEVRSFLTRGWRPSNLPKFLPNRGRVFSLEQRGEEDIALSLFGEAQEGISRRLDRGTDSPRLQDVTNWTFALLDLNHVSAAAPPACSRSCSSNGGTFILIK